MTTTEPVQAAVDRCPRCWCDCGGLLAQHTADGCGCEDCQAHPEYECSLAKFTPSERIALIAERLGPLLSVHLGPRAQRRCLAVAHAAHHGMHDYDYPEDAQTDGPAALQAAQDLLNLVSELRIPVFTNVEGYAEVVVERGPGPYRDHFGVTDGATLLRSTWIEGEGWKPIRDIGSAHTYRHTMAAAVDLARHVAAIEAASPRPAHQPAAIKESHS